MGREHIKKGEQQVGTFDALYPTLDDPRLTPPADPQLTPPTLRPTSHSSNFTLFDLLFRSTNIIGTPHQWVRLHCNAKHTGMGRSVPERHPVEGNNVWAARDLSPLENHVRDVHITFWFWWAFPFPFPFPFCPIPINFPRHALKSTNGGRRALLSSGLPTATPMK
jgi:hypothetical protein